ncbi:uncharacterized protein LOC110117694 isoform X2 [Ceratitis capitata]|uniref:uncharacterized protein LOC110117694 isoform X2 n=1 Tax=Ceratitis capitata TaxID=7213 RepID=UPI000A1095EC|nr:uncharacterized protein LOC110117694 isoform X2 [Ceratitis capitata]
MNSIGAVFTVLAVLILIYILYSRCFEKSGKVDNGQSKMHINGKRLSQLEWIQIKEKICNINNLALEERYVYLKILKDNPQLMVAIIKERQKDEKKL